MVDRLFIACIGICGMSFTSVYAQEKEYPPHFSVFEDYGIPKDILDLSALKRCEKLKGRYPWLRINTATIQQQSCFRDDERNDRVTAIYFFDHEKRFIALLAFVFERAEDPLAPIEEKKYGASWLLVSEGLEERGEVTKRWRSIPDVDMDAYLRPRAERVFRKLCVHYHLQCLLRKR